MIRAGARLALWGGKRLPYDAELEYLESTGTQYIDTGVHINTATDVVSISFWTKPQVRSSSVVRPALFGVSDSSSRYFEIRQNVPASDSASKDSLAYLLPAQDTLVANGFYNVDDEGWHILEISKTSYSFDGTQNSITGVVDYTFAGNLMLFAFKTSGIGVSGLGGEFRISSFSIIRSGVKIMDLIPVRVGTTGYMYDRVTRKLFGNQGTGDFVLGPDVIPVEWLESHGTEYIDTEVKLRSTDTIDTRLYINSSYTTIWYGILGSRDADRYLILRCVASDDSILNVTAPNHYYDFTRFTWGNLSFAFGGDYHESATNCYLFSYNNNGTAYSRLPYRFANFSIARDSLKIINLLPVRVGSGSTFEGAMMDVLTRRIYRNQGTGAFAYGADLPLGALA